MRTVAMIRAFFRDYLFLPVMGAWYIGMFLAYLFLMVCG